MKLYHGKHRLDDAWQKTAEQQYIASRVAARVQLRLQAMKGVNSNA